MHLSKYSNLIKHLIALIIAFKHFHTVAIVNSKTALLQLIPAIINIRLLKINKIATLNYFYCKSNIAKFDLICNFHHFVIILYLH